MSSQEGSDQRTSDDADGKDGDETLGTAEGENKEPEPQPGSGVLATQKPGLRKPFHYFSYAVIAALLVLVDPFQWKQVTSNASQDLAQRSLIGPLYPTDHRGRTTVVLMNEATLEHLDATWPTPLGTHARLLRIIRDMGPRAVMVDFVFPDERDDPTVAELRQEILAFEDEGIPLYFARAEGSGLDWIRPGLPEAKLVSIVEPVSDGVSRTYDVCSRAPDGKPGCACAAEGSQFTACPAGTDATSPQSPVALTAAFQLFKELQGLPQGFSVQEPVPMDVIWSNRFNEVNDTWMKKDSTEDLEDLCIDMVSGVWDWLNRALRGSERYGFRQTCPYTTTLSARMLLRAPGHPELEKHLRGKVVFYGADLAGLEDTVVPPTHVKLPGVYLHAMALDNLLTFEGRYKKSAISIDGIGVDSKVLNVAVAILLASIVVAFARNERVIKAQEVTAGNERGGAYFRILWRRWKHWISFNLVMLAAILFVCFVLYVWFEISPKNWIGYWGLLAFLSGVARSRLVEGGVRFLTDGLVPLVRNWVLREGKT